ncbi:MAG TPA: SHOCT domain-containing protein [Deltaproteobacteria bacterium]|nr:SHOCT domain-containing protein [Pseudomonadota bacterium]HON61600.1 SHOCT domain-containing protein [Deltaproteobacteria bacterium]HRR21980.1 SHOCT domain-containing protein [Desulfomonilia bacterium]HPX49622.1 SHOCT domain-containing protein [Deltaproteobacteria bacterium]HQA71001.1 SHOCT domain-containing protein [Deltaproteobacteria bacterium]
MRKAYPAMTPWLAALLVLVLPTAATAQRYYGNGWCMMGPWFGGALMWIVIILLAALLIYLLIRSTKQPSPPREAGAETPLDIVKKRYARGEITKAEFEEMKKDLAG